MTEKNVVEVPEKLPSRFYIGEWSVDSELLTLSNESGQTALEPKMMSVLLYLAECSGRVVSREELERVVWQGTVVSYDALTSTINKLRKALGDNSSRPGYIKTIPKKGYSLIALIKRTDSPTAIDEVPRQLPKYSKWVVNGVVLLGIMIVSVATWLLQPPQRVSETRLDPLPTLVVLPFDNLNSDKGPTYFSDGITADITTALSKLSGLFVISWASATTLPHHSSEDIRTIARTLKVRYVLQGSLRRTENRVRINTQLIDATTGINIWAERYDREIKAMLDLQDEIAAEIATALSITLTEQEKLRQSRRYTTDITAYDKFLQGQSAYVRSNRDDNLLARNLFQSAIDKDPKFARAYGALALTYADEYRFRWGADEESALARAFALANKAVEIDSQLPQPYWVRGYIYLHKKNYSKSIEQIRMSIALDPNNSDGYAMLALAQIHDGDPKSALRLINRAMNLNPHYPARYPSVLGQSYYYLERYQEAIYPLREAIKRNVELITPHLYLIAALEKAGLHGDAVWAANQLEVLRPGFSVNNIPHMIPNKDHDKIQGIMRELRMAGL